MKDIFTFALLISFFGANAQAIKLSNFAMDQTVIFAFVSFPAGNMFRFELAPGEVRDEDIREQFRRYNRCTTSRVA